MKILNPQNANFNRTSGEEEAQKTTDILDEFSAFLSIIEFSDRKPKQLLSVKSSSKTDHKKADINIQLIQS